MANKKIKEVVENIQLKKNKSEWYNLRPVLGCANWAVFYVLLGARETGKSYAVFDFVANQFVNKGIPFIWMRLTEAQARELLQNNAEKLGDADIKRKYGLDLVTSGSNVYHVTKRSEPDKNGKTKVLEKKLMARVFSLSTFYKQKGSLFDSDFLKDEKMRYNIVLDEFQKEKGERNTFSVTYALTNQLENLTRSTKDRLKIFFMGNTLEEASDILCAFNFIPEQFGRYKLVKNKKQLIKYLEARKNANNAKEIQALDAKYKDVDFGRRCVIEYLAPSELYLNRRKGTIADMLMPKASTFTNQVETDKTLVTKERLVSPQYVIKFSKDRDDWFTVWNNNIIAPYHNEHKPAIAMRPYLDNLYSIDRVKAVIEIFDTRGYQFRNLITFKKFQSELSLLKPRQG